MYAITITTKDKCRHCINDFDNELQLYLLSKDVSIIDFWYKLEESKFTKWHCHGLYKEKWNTSPSDKFYVYFKECTDIEKWLGYSSKSETVKLLDDGIFLKE